MLATAILVGAPELALHAELGLESAQRGDEGLDVAVRKGGSLASAVGALRTSMRTGAILHTELPLEAPPGAAS